MSAKVLVVDDSGTMRKIIIRSLNTVGFTDIVEAADGNDGLTAFQRHAFDLVMTDWNMPVKTGIELTRDIRAGQQGAGGDDHHRSRKASRPRSDPSRCFGLPGEALHPRSAARKTQQVCLLTNSPRIVARPTFSSAAIKEPSS